MAQQGVIYPAAPLMIVDRQYRRKKKGDTDLPRFSVNPAKRDITISVLGKETSRKSNSQAPKIVGPRAAILQNTNFKFVDGHQCCNVPRAKTHRLRKRKEPSESDTTVAANDSPSESTSSDLTQPSSRQSLLLQGVPNASKTFYAYTGSQIPSDAQDLLNYYAFGIARSMYPLSNIITFDINPVKAVWLPLAADDEALLNAALLSSQIHRSHYHSGDNQPHSNRYFQYTIKHINARLAAGEVCDAIIASVSCLAIVEHFLEHYEPSSMHLSGLVEMLKVRGGMRSVHKPLQMKIIRADLIPSVDRLIPPSLPRLRPTMPPLHAIMFPTATDDDALAEALGASGMSLHVSDIALAMSALSKAVEYAIDTNLTIPSRAYDEDTMGILYDLLLMRTDNTNDIDIAYRSAGLIYMKSLTREDACNFDAIVTPMVSSISNIQVNSANARLLFWINFMGAMTAQNHSKRVWFREQLAFLREFLNIVDLIEAQAILKEISFIPKVHGDSSRLVWDALTGATQQPPIPTAIHPGPT